MIDISTMMMAIKGIESDTLAVHQERCVKVRNRNASCRRCADACTSGALSFNENTLLVSAEHCIGCGTCATVCPTAALEARNPTDVELMHTCVEVLRAGSCEVTIACEPKLEALKHSYDQSRVIEVRCLGRVDESALVCLVALGAQSITLLHGGCDDCPNGKGVSTYLLVQDTFDTLMRSWGHVNPLTITDELPHTFKLSRREARATGDIDGLSRRQLFTQLKQGAQRTVVDMAEKHLPSVPALGQVQKSMEQETTNIPVIRVMRDGTLPHFIPSRRERLLDKLDHLGQPQVEYLETRLWGHISFNDKLCNSCRMCATFCPTEAIYKFDDPNGSFGIEHYPSDCVQCRLCEDICPTGAITLESRVPVKELVEGVIETHVMKPLTRIPSAPDSIMVSIKQLFNDTNINDRP